MLRAFQGLLKLIQLFIIEGYLVANDLTALQWSRGEVCLYFGTVLRLVVQVKASGLVNEADSRVFLRYFCFFCMILNLAG